MSTTLVELRTQVKREARVKGTDQLDEMVDDIIVEVHDQHTERQRFDELFEPDEVLTLTAANGIVALPDDFQHMGEVRFSSDGSSFRRLEVRGPYNHKRGNYGFPKFYEKTGSNIRLYPPGDILDTHALHIDYYRKATFDSSNDVLPVDKLVPLVRREVISRVHMYYKENQSATAYQGLARQAIGEIQSSVETGNK